MEKFLSRGLRISIRSMTPNPKVIYLTPPHVKLGIMVDILYIVSTENLSTIYLSRYMCVYIGEEWIIY